MKPYYEDNLVTIYHGHALNILQRLSDESIQVCLCSPPYWGLRNYAGGSDIIWGGDEKCDHIFEGSEYHKHREKKVISGKSRTTERFWGEPSRKFDGDHQKHVSNVFCVKCHSWKGQLGLEPTPEMYVEHLMMIFREVKRVLKKEGSFWLNIGDTYAGSGMGAYSAGVVYNPDKLAKVGNAGGFPAPRPKLDILAKCIVCIPERVMFAMIEDDWILRNKCIWHKPNAMPASVKDRFTTSWEFLFFFCKARERKGWENVRAYYMTEPEKAWLAAMIDGEGCISIAKEQNNRGFQLAVEVANNKLAIAERCKSITGLGSITHLASGAHHYHFGGKMAEIILKQVYPYLVIKKEQAKVGLYLQSLNKLRGAPKGQQGGTRLLTEEELKERLRLQQLCQDLNQGRIESSGLPEPDFTLPQRYIGCEKYYFNLDAVRVPHAVSSIKRVQYSRHGEGDFYENGQISFSLARSQKEIGKAGLYTKGRGVLPFNLRVRDVKRGKGGATAQGGELKASEKEVEEYEYPEKPDWRKEAAKKGQLFDQPVAHQGGGNTGLGKHPGSSHDGRAGFDREARDRPLIAPHHRYRGDGWEQQAIEGREPKTKLTERQESIVGHFEQKGSGGHYLYGGLESPEGTHEHHLGKNPGDLWEINTAPFKGAHFAVFPEALCIKPILACSRPGDIVLDPFAGSGTVGVVAKKLGRKTILIDIVEGYVKIAIERIRKIPIPFPIGHTTSKEGKDNYNRGFETYHQGIP